MLLQSYDCACLLLRFFANRGFCPFYFVISRLLNRNVFPIAIALVGTLLRCCWPADMEWKFDEQEMFRLAGEAWNHGLPFMGMPSGAGLPNAGFSIWPFALLYGIHPTPLFMGMGVQWLNSMALWLMLYCAGRYEEAVRTRLYWGLAAYAVSVMPVLFARKIWAQDLLPIFVATLWWVYLNRQKLPLLFLGGVVCALAGQLHLSGFFYAGGWFFALLVFKKINPKQVFWLLCGGMVGFLPGIPWLQVVLQHGGGISHWGNIFKLEFWLRVLTDTPGFNIHYAAAGEISTFSAFPNGLYVGLILGLGLMVCTAIAIKNGIITIFQKDAHENEINFLLVAFVVLPGVLMTLSAIPVRSHYMIGALPFCSIGMAVFLQKTTIKGLSLLRFWALLQLLFTLSFMVFVHQKQHINGDYGSTYRSQTQAK